MSLPATYIEGFHDLEKVKKVSYVDFGKTGLKVSKLGFGGGAFGNHYDDYTMAEATATVEEAVKSGINYIDTAPFYGEGRSETTLGVALKNIPRSAYYIATKVARYSLDTERAFDFSYENTLKSVDESLKRLQLDYVDIIQVHDIEFAPSVDIIVNETLPALEKAVKDGKARFIGVTGFPVSKLKELIDASKTKIDSVLSYARLTLLDDVLLDFIPGFKSKGLGVIHAASPALGLLINRGPWPWIPCQDELKQVAAKAAAYCKERDVELGRLAVYWTSQQSGVDVHLIGIQNRDLLRSNLEIFTSGISEKEKTVLQELLDKKILEPSKRLTWEGIEVTNYWKEMKKIGKA